MSRTSGVLALALLALAGGWVLKVQLVVEMRM
jgi:hypothetical protein